LQSFISASHDRRKKEVDHDARTFSLQEVVGLCTTYKNLWLALNHGQRSSQQSHARRLRHRLTLSTSESLEIERSSYVNSWRERPVFHCGGAKVSRAYASFRVEQSRVQQLHSRVTFVRTTSFDFTIGKVLDVPTSPGKTLHFESCIRKTHSESTGRQWKAVGREKKVTADFCQNPSPCQKPCSPHCSTDYSTRVEK